MRLETLFQYRGKRIPLPLDRISEDTKFVFSTGHCHSLALALHKKTGWQLAAIVTQQSENPRKQLADMFKEPVDMAAVGRRWAHVGVLSPEGKFVDINGTSTVEEALSKHSPKGWKADKRGPYSQIVKLTAKQVEELYFCSGSGFFTKCLKPNPEAAAPFADLVLQSI